MALDAKSQSDGQHLLVVSGPSGSGKTTLIRRLMMAVPGLYFSVSHTTRKRRPGETPGVDYHFVNYAEFTAMIKAKAFVEWAAVHGERYGTSWSELRAVEKSDRTMILDVDIQGAEAVRKMMPASISVFIMPPSMQELRRRLMHRESQWTHTMEQRLETARHEMSLHHCFDFIVINDVLDNALDALVHIVNAMELRAQRQLSRVKRILGGQ
ncbi:MAG TPA: guanylate kinase [Candidatus Aminicenantes bacterium]|nr:guanylate kinase [Candidatus Aminicenantes bacterium]